jgi:GT2 family glycosyltransferase
MQTFNQKQNLERYPKVLVGCPTSFHKDYCLKQYIQGLNKLTYPRKDILLIENSQNNEYLNLIENFEIPVEKGPWFKGAIQRIITSRNILRKKVLDEGYDFFLSLEQDVIPPKDIIERMLRHAKHVVSGIYFLDEKLTAKAFPLTKEQLWDDPGLYEIGSAGLGCVLIHRSILESIEFRSENKEFDDRFFYKDCKEKEIPIFCDTSIKCKHLTKEMHWETIEK